MKLLLKGIKCLILVLENMDIICNLEYFLLKKIFFFFFFFLVVEKNDFNKLIELLHQKNHEEVYLGKI